MQRGGSINPLSIGYPFRVYLRTASPLVEYHCQGNLGLSVYRAFTCNAVTQANILSSKRSKVGYPSSSQQIGMLPYQSLVSRYARYSLKVKS